MLKWIYKLTQNMFISKGNDELCFHGPNLHILRQELFESLPVFYILQCYKIAQRQWKVGITKQDILNRTLSILPISVFHSLCFPEGIIPTLGF